jgi:hypothetical protein
LAFICDEEDEDGSVNFCDCINVGCRTYVVELPKMKSGGRRIHWMGKISV